MDGEKLRTAATIMVEAGKQIDEMIDILEEKLIEAFTNEKEKKSAEEYDYEGENNKGNDWISKCWLWDIELQKETRKGHKKTEAHIAIKVVLYNEDEMKDSNWEPSLYVIYKKGEKAFNLENSLWIHSAKKEGWELDGNRLWRWKEEDEEGWAFVLPLVELDSENTLKEQIILPVKKLLENSFASNPFPDKPVAFQFNQGKDGLSILKLSPKGKI